MIVPFTENGLRLGVFFGGYLFLQFLFASYFRTKSRVLIRLMETEVCVKEWGRSPERGGGASAAIPSPITPQVCSNGQTTPSRDFCQSFVFSDECTIVGGFVCCRCGEVVLVDFSFPGIFFLQIVVLKLESLVFYLCLPNLPFLKSRPGFDFRKSVGTESRRCHDLSSCVL